jgi:hypothetical protein
VRFDALDAAVGVDGDGLVCVAIEQSAKDDRLRWRKPPFVTGATKASVEFIPWLRA